MKITTSFFKVMVLLALFTIHCSLFTQAGNLANYEVVPLPQHIDLQKGEPFVLSNQVQILAGEGLQREALFLQQYIKEMSDLDLAIADKRQKRHPHRGRFGRWCILWHPDTEESRQRRGSPACSHYFRCSPFRLAWYAPRLFTSFLLNRFREEVHRPTGTPQYEPLPLASDRRPRLAY